jgi:chemotaxis protein MotB
VNLVRHAKAPGSLRRWRVASAILALAGFTLVAGYYVPAQREVTRLREERRALDAEQAALRQRLELNEQQLTAARARDTQLTNELEAERGNAAEIKQRIDKLKDMLGAQFGRLSQARMLTVSSAGDRVSVAIAIPALFPENGPSVSHNGRSLLCQLSTSIMAEFSGQIRVTGYYGKVRIEEPELARRYATPWQLSAARAASAVDVLEKSCGAATDRFLVVGYGPRAAGPLGANVALEFAFKSGA